MTLNEIAYNIRNVVSGGVGSDDTDISLRQIKFMVHYHRANLLLQYTDNGRKSSSVNFQVDNQKPSSSGITLKQFVGFNNDRALRSIAFKDDSTVEASYTVLPVVQHHDRAFVNESRFIKSAGSKIATISDRKLYIWEGDSLVTDGSIEINAIFANPTEVSSYVDDETTTYPIPEEMVSVLIKNLLQAEFNVMSVAVSKTPNNQVDEKPTTSKSK